MYIQPDQINMTVLFWYLAESNASVRYGTYVHWTNHVLQGTRNTRPCLTGHPVIPSAPGESAKMPVFGREDTL